MGRVLLIAAFLLLSPAFAPAADYVIGEGDTLVISVWGERDLSHQVKVRPDGKISLPAVGEVAAANLTVRGLQSALTEKFGRVVKNPVVTVMVAEVTNNKVYVFGGGVGSGVYSLTQRATLLQILCLIGQRTPANGGAGDAAGTSSSVRSADLKNAYVLRAGKKIKQNFHNLFINGDITEDVALEPNDAVFIPAHLNKNVYVMGAVTTPKFIEYREGLTVMEAILEAGGFTKFASQNDTVIYRRQGGRETTIPVKMKKLINNGDVSQNAQLQPGDYVVAREGIF